MEEIERRRPRSQACSASDQPPPVNPRRDTLHQGLRRHHSTNPNHLKSTSLMTQEPYESDFEKINKILRHSLSAKSGNQRPKTVPEHPGSDLRTTTAARPRSQTQLLVQPVREDDEDIYLAAEEIATYPGMTKSTTIHTRSLSPLTVTSSKMFNYPKHPIEASNSARYATHPPKKQFQPDTAIYGVAQGRGSNLVMDLIELQTAANNLYRNLLNANTSAPELADLRTHLRTGDKAPTSEILQHVYQTLRPPDPRSTEKEEEYSGIYLVNFRDCKERNELREKLLQLFTLPGPPSVMYQKITAKLNALIHSFVDIVVKMRAKKNETLASPYHAQSLLGLLNAGQEGEHLVRVLQSNELWIKWGTETGLPPLPHVYMLRHPPSYEVRKAIVLSNIAEKRDVIRTMLTRKTRLESLIPPIYSKLEGDRWQVSRYDSETRKMETQVASFPLWVEECTKLAYHLKSSNRSSFKHGDHIYALYSVYLVVVKDITLAENGGLQKESRMPCSHQIFVGSSSTGVLYRFLNVQDNHCENIKSILDEGPKMKSYRCRQETELVEACLALSWIRQQPRAVFVINSFQEGDMTNLSLNKKKPFHDKMINLEQHCIQSKKLGPTNHMRYGMNKLGDKLSP